ARPLAGTTAEHELPPGVVLVSAEPTPRVVGRTLTWDLGPLGPGERRAVKVRARAEAPGSVAAEALAGFRTSYTLATPLTRPRLTLALGLPATVLTGKEAFLQARVGNSGTAPAEDAELIIRLPPGLEHPDGGVVRTSLGTLAPGEKRRLRWPVRATWAGRQ